MGLESHSSLEDIESDEIVNDVQIRLKYSPLFKSYSLGLPEADRNVSFVDGNGKDRSCMTILSTGTEDPERALELFERAKQLAKHGKNANEIFEIIFNECL